MNSYRSQECFVVCSLDPSRLIVRRLVYIIQNTRGFPNVGGFFFWFRAPQQINDFSVCLMSDPLRLKSL